MALTKVNRQLVQPMGSFDATSVQGKVPSDFLPSTHPSAAFSYNPSDGRVKHNGNDVSVGYAMNADNATNANKWAGLQIRVGGYTSGANGYITFGI